MIELAIKTALERITGLNAYPLLLPDKEQEGITFLRVSDPPVGAGMIRTGLSAVRIQISIYLLDNYSRLLSLDSQIWSAWQQIAHGQLDGHPVQYVTRGSIRQDQSRLPNGRIQYSLVRDFIFTTPE